MNTDLHLTVAGLKYLSDRTTEEYAAARLKAESEVTKGSRIAVYAPDGTKLGALSRSAPEKTAGVGDAGAFLDWVKEHHPDKIEFDLEIVGSDEKVKAVLYEHAKELVKPVEKVSPAFRASVLEASTAYGAPAGPGGELDVPGIVVSANAPTVVSFKPSDGSRHAIVELLREGKVQLPDLLAEPSAVDGAE
ncbi:hypothetical protein ACFORH_42805 [Amycolatopsis roodepoortensis]|uniref:Uncharacterized protein n=1 Tax=Amycolatopsis roodepoortensis TaxID=700274 RepID=A0ABR9L2P3_9PSEU|nr:MULTISPECIES: hypothetical protein [Amycolatopsis]MBE1575024.1 hypothetical protein [Amycolatopsis roodepoortensis]GHG97438.1 hypothetical protein GCM10017788_76940 [Amycolatopsis acidiphila]